MPTSTEHSVKGLNFFNPAEQRQLQTLQHGEFNIHGWRRADLVAHVPLTPSALSRQLARLRTLGLIKKVAHTYHYYLTCLGRSAIAAACSITRFNIIPAMGGRQPVEGLAELHKPVELTAALGKKKDAGTA